MNRAKDPVSKRQSAAKTRFVKPVLANWRYPRLLPYAGFAAVIVLYAMARAGPNRLEAKVVNFGLSFLPSSVVSAHLSDILNGARDHDVIVSPSALRRTGIRLIRAADKNTANWSAAKATLDYRSYLNEQFGQVPKVENAKEAGPEDLPYFYALHTKPDPQATSGSVLVARIQTDGGASPAESARLETLADPQPPASGARLIVIEGKTDRIVLDGEYWKNVIIKNAKVEYEGGPLKFENVYFVNCEFTVAQTPGGRAFANAVLKGGATNFKYGTAEPQKH